MYSLLLLCLLTPAAGRDDAKSELAKFQGFWKSKTVEMRGSKSALGPQLSTQYTFVVVGDRCNGPGFPAGTIKLNPAKQEVDFLITAGSQKGQTVHGLYEMDDDVLVIALPNSTGRRFGPPEAAERPKGFKTNLNSMHTTYTFERDPATTKEQAAKYIEDRGLRADQQAREAALRAPVTHEEFAKFLERFARLEKRLEELEKKLAEKK